MKSPTISTLSALAEALAVPISALVDGTTSAARRLHVVRAAERLAFIDPASGARREVFGRRSLEAKWSSCAMRCRHTP